MKRLVIIAGLCCLIATSASGTLSTQPDPLRNKTIVPNKGFGNAFNKFWITPQGRVVWFFVSGDSNEGIISEIGAGVTPGETLLQYDPSGNAVDYAKHKGPIIRVTAPYLARATSNGAGTLNFSYSFSASHKTKSGVKVEEMEMTTLKVDISANECLISGSSSNTIRRDGRVVQNNNQDLPPDRCTVSDGNN